MAVGRVPVEYSKHLLRFLPSSSKERVIIRKIALQYMGEWLHHYMRTDPRLVKNWVNECGRQFNGVISFASQVLSTALLSVLFSLSCIII
jgi:hypothetical protein